jgi:hypothetical protein
MIKNVSNIGQMIMPTIARNKAVSGKGDAQSSKRFSVGREESPENQRTDADARTDNVSEKDTVKYDKNTIQGNEKADDKKLNGYTHKRAEEKTDGKKELKESQNVEDNQNINTLQENNQENINTDIAANSCEENVTNPKGQITQALNLYISEKSNSVTGDAVKSEQIKALHETEKGQLGIKTILPEKSNGQNGLKQIFEQISQMKVNTADLSENQIPQTNTEQLSNGNVEQIKSDTLISAAGKNGDENNDKLNSTTEQKKGQFEFAAGDKEKSDSQSSSDANRQQENEQDTK